MDMLSLKFEGEKSEIALGFAMADFLTTTKLLMCLQSKNVLSATDIEWVLDSAANEAGSGNQPNAERIIRGVQSALQALARR